jgi:hypothetical protein
MRWWMAALVLAFGVGEARAQNNVPLPLPLEPFQLTTPVYPSYGDSTGCDSWSPPSRDKRRGQEDNPSGGRPANPVCPAR